MPCCCFATCSVVYECKQRVEHRLPSHHKVVVRLRNSPGSAIPVSTAGALSLPSVVPANRFNSACGGLPAPCNPWAFIVTCYRFSAYSLTAKRKETASPLFLSDRNSLRSFTPSIHAIGTVFQYASEKGIGHAVTFPFVTKQPTIQLTVFVFPVVFL